MSLLNVLVSHAYVEASWERIMLSRPRQVRFLLDSGAFTNFTLQQRGTAEKIFPKAALNDDASLNLDFYLQRIDRLKDALWQYIMLDVPLNEQASEANLAEMVRRGYRPMPVLTTDAPLELLRDYVKINPHICIAGGVTQELKYYTSRLEKAHRITNGEARLHGLGFTRMATVRSRAWSVDSSSWLQAGRFGQVSYLDKTTGGMKAAYVAADKDPKRKGRFEIARLLSRAQMGEDYGGLNRKRGTFSVMNILSVNQWLDYAGWARKHGLEFFFAIGSTRDFLLVASLAAHRDPDTGRIDAAALNKINRSIANKETTTEEALLRVLQMEMKI